MPVQFATFYINDGLFGIDVLLVREINRNLDITEVSPAPEFVAGLMNLRGQIVTIIDPGVRLGLGRRPRTDDTCCIVLKTKQETERMVQEGLSIETTAKDIIGLIVDRIGDMTIVGNDDIEQPPANINGVDGKFLTGVVKLEHELLGVLKIAEILN